MAEEVEEAPLFKRKPRRGAHARPVKRRAGAPDGAGADEGDDDDEDALDLEEKITAAKLEQRLRKRVKGLQAVADDAMAEEPEKDDLGIGTAFMEQTSTTELDRARERYVQEQLERVRRGEEPVAPFPKSTLNQVSKESRFVSPATGATDAADSLWLNTSRVVPEVDLPDAGKQYSETKLIMEEARKRDLEQSEATAREQPERIIHNYNALNFGRPSRQVTDFQARKKEMDKSRMKF